MKSRSRREADIADGSRSGRYEGVRARAELPAKQADWGWHLGEQGGDSKRGAMAVTRKLAAILVADIAGFSRLAGADED